MAPMPWFRFYSEAVRDTKLRRIARKTDRPFAETVGTWAIILSFASESPQRGQLLLSDGNPVDPDDISDVAGCNADETLQQLQSNGMITVTDGIICVSAWNKRQYESDNSTPRVNKFRDKRRNVAETLHERYSNADVTPPDTDTDTDTDTEGKASSLVKSELAPPLAATPPDPAKTPQKARKQKPAPVEENRPPEIDTLHSIVGVYPPRETWETLAAAASGYTEAQMRQTYAAWRTVTPNKHNWTWVSEWLPYGGKPPSPYSKPNGKMTMPPGCPPPEQLWGMVQREIDRVHSYGKPELPAQVIKAIESVGGWYTVCKCDPEGPTPARLRDAYRSVIHG